MEIKLTKEDKAIIVYSECPRCHLSYNTKARKKTQHHAIPLFLKPKTEVTVSLCKTCHEELNSYYKPSQINSIKYGLSPKDFEEFKANYTRLREEFHAKKIGRGEFGEGLWSNLVNYLEVKNE